VDDLAVGGRAGQTLGNECRIPVRLSAMAIDNMRQFVFRRMLVREAGTAAEASAVAAAAGRLWEHLARQLVPLIGDAGIAALCDRGVHLAQRQVPGLALPPLSEADGTPFTRAHQFIANQEPALVDEAAVALLTTVTELLASFIGDSLTTRLLREAWPDDFNGNTTGETT